LQRGLKKTEGAILGLLAALPVEAHDVADAAQRSLAVQRERLDAELRDIDERLNELTARRVRLTVKLGDGLIDDDEYATVIRLTDKQRDELRARREQLAAERERVPAGSDVYERVLAVFAKLGNWTELPRKAAIEQQQEVYRCCVAAARYLPDRKTLQVQWTREIAPYMPVPVQDVVP
jgi:hypothetical protein